MTSNIKQQFQIVLEKLPKKKIPELATALKNNKLNSSSSLYDFKNELHFSDSQIKLVKQSLELLPDSFSAGILFALLEAVLS